MLLLAAVMREADTVVLRSGIGLGSVIAVVSSWDRNRSIIWAIVAGLLSWVYVIYFAITREPRRSPPPA